jgi:hypothetical protein
MSHPTPHQPERAGKAEPYYKKLATRVGLMRRGRNGPKRVFEPLPQPSRERLDASLGDAPIDTEKLVSEQASLTQEKEKTVLYLAYGSNLCNETFRGVRGIRPLSQVNVLVPTLRLTFDLPGIPYSEPCFANTALRIPDAPPSPQSADYHKDRWQKGLVGVVYEVTLRDYAHIIATEGAGSAYHDILVECYVLPSSSTVPTTPDSPPFKAHTLFAPIVSTTPHATERTTRPDPSYAQASARYLKLITDGAMERELPAEYQTYLHELRPYTITTKRQAVGKALFMAIWIPIIMAIFALSRQLQDDKGRAPKWLAAFSALAFKSMWMCYDSVFKGAFGDGERTTGDEEVVRTARSGSIDAEKEGLLEEVVEVLNGSVGEERGREWKEDV